MELFRLSREAYADNLSGKGAAKKGARWNSAGVELVYTAGNRSLEMAEVAVHFTLSTLPDDYVMLTIYVPDTISMQKISTIGLPQFWNTFPHSSTIQAIGDKFVSDNQFCILQVPSAVTKGDYNYLINPYHPENEKIKIIASEKFPFDNRIFSSQG
jgi:RES domain-containing protein